MTESSSGHTPKISVLVPTYNRAPMLGAFLAGILAQTFRDFEVVISDNCSTDDTPAVVNALVDPRIRYYRNDTNIGPFGNFNRLLALARGEYACIVHDDDAYRSEFLAREADMLDRYPNVGMVHCAVGQIDASGARQRVVRAYPTTRVINGKQQFIRYLQGHNVCCSSVMARLDVYRAAGPFDTKHICADWLMWLRLALLADVAWIADPLLDIRVHPESVTGSLNPQWWYEEFRAIFDEGVAQAFVVDPSLVKDRQALLAVAARAQGRRFLIAALSALAQNAVPLAREYTDVLEQMRAIGLPHVYAWTVRLLTNPVGGRVLSVVAGFRRARARRHAQGLSSEKARV